MQDINNIPGHIVPIFPMSIANDPHTIACFDAVLIVLLRSFYWRGLVKCPLFLLELTLSLSLNLCAVVRLYFLHPTGWQIQKPSLLFLEKIGNIFAFNWDIINFGILFAWLGIKMVEIHVSYIPVRTKNLPFKFSCFIFLRICKISKLVSILSQHFIWCFILIFIDLVLSAHILFIHVPIF